MGIVAIVFGAALYSISGPQVEQEIRENHGGIEDLALQARTMSYSYQQPFVVELRAGEARMMPLANPDDSRDEDDDDRASSPSALKPLDSFSWPRVFKVDPQYEISVKRWDSNDYLRVDDDDVVRWVHQPNTPCEPLAIQLVSEDGNALLSRTFHPLTAKGVDDEMTIQNP